MARPRKFDRDARVVSVRLPARLHDDLIREARVSRIDVSDVMRKRLARQVLYLKTSADGGSSPY